MGFVAMVAALPTGFRWGNADASSAQHKHEGVAVYLLQRWRGIRNNLGFVLIPQGAEPLLWQILKDVSDGVEGARTFITQVLPRRIMKDNYQTQTPPSCSGVHFYQENTKDSDTIDIMLLVLDQGERFQLVKKHPHVLRRRISSAKVA